MPCNFWHVRPRCWRNAMTPAPRQIGSGRSTGQMTLLVKLQRTSSTSDTPNDACGDIPLLRPSTLGQQLVLVAPLSLWCVACHGYPFSARPAGSDLCSDTSSGALEFKKSKRSRSSSMYIQQMQHANMQDIDM